MFSSYHISNWNDFCHVAWRKITDKGIGNGISLLIMVGIIANLPLSFTQEFVSRVSENNVVS